MFQQAVNDNTNCTLGFRLTFANGQARKPALTTGSINNNFWCSFRTMCIKVQFYYAQTSSSSATQCLRAAINYLLTLPTCPYGQLFFYMLFLFFFLSKDSLQKT